MTYDMMSIASSGIQAQRLKMDVIASNIANKDSNYDSQGNYQPYLRKQVNFKTVLDNVNNAQLGVQVNSISTDTENMQKSYAPNNPNADEYGYVYESNVHIAREMSDLLSAKNAYQANVTTIKTFKSMFNSALEI